jgi:hypothetical protein
MCLLYWKMHVSFVCRFFSSGSIHDIRLLAYPTLPIPRWRSPPPTLYPPSAHFSLSTCFLLGLFLIYYTLSLVHFPSLCVLFFMPSYVLPYHFHLVYPFPRTFLRGPAIACTSAKNPSFQLCIRLTLFIIPPVPSPSPSNVFLSAPLA